MSTTLTKDVPVMDVDLYSEEMIADPWPSLRRIREAGPVVWNKCGHWMSAQDRVCRYIFNHPEALGAEPAITGFFGREAFIAIDDKSQHNALRNIWAIAFRRDTLQPLATLIRQITSDLLDPLIERMRAGETVDIAADVCRLIPAFVISHMMGVADEMQWITPKPQTHDGIARPTVKRAASLALPRSRGRRRRRCRMMTPAISAG